MSRTKARPDDFWRLVAEAEKRQLQLHFAPSREEFFVTSASDPVLLHHVTPAGCDCQGFNYLRRCTHHSLLIERLGWLPDVDP